MSRAEQFADNAIVEHVFGNAHLVQDTSQHQVESCGKAEISRIEAHAAQLDRDPLTPIMFCGSRWGTSVAQHLSSSHRSLDAKLLSNDLRPSGLFLLTSQLWRWGIPIPLSKSAETHLTFDGTPLLDRTQGATALASLFRSRHALAPLLLKMVSAEGPFIEAIRAACHAAGARFALTQSYQRAALVCETPFEQWFEITFSRKRRKEFRRLRTRLSERGNLQTISFQSGDDITSWIDDFLKLERSSWKGARGTAMSQNANQERALRQALSTLARHNELFFWRLDLNGQPISMLFAMSRSNRAWLGKIAHDARYEQYSPGVLIILDATESFLSSPDIKIVDSCARPNHPMIDNIWRDRLAFADILIAPPGMPKTLFSTLVWAEKTRLRARQTLKSLWLFINGRSKS